MIPSKILNNNKGQALIEAVAISSVFLVGLVFLVAVFYNQMVFIAVDDAIETYFFCHIQKKQLCRSQLEARLRQLKINSIQIDESNNDKNFELTINAETNYNYEFHKKRQLYFDFKLEI